MESKEYFEKVMQDYNKNCKRARMKTANGGSTVGKQQIR